MKKYIYLLIALFGFASAVNANGVNVGVSILGGVFDADGTEKFSGAHVSGGSPGNVTKKTATEGDEAETAFYIGSLFAEKELNDNFAVGLDFVPMSMDSETTENVQKQMGSDKTNKVDVTFENMTATSGLTQGEYSTGGLRVKSYPNSTGLVTDITYSNIFLDNVYLPVQLLQHYCPWPCKTQATSCTGVRQAAIALPLLC